MRQIGRCNQDCHQDGRCLPHAPCERYPFSLERQYLVILKLIWTLSLGFGKIRTKAIVKTNGVHQLWKTSDLPWSIFVRNNFKRIDMKHCSFCILFFFVFYFQTVAQEYAPLDTSHYETLTKNVYKALKQENRKFLEPHIMNAEAFKEVITEYSKHVQGVTPEMVMRELSDPKKTAEMTTMLEKKFRKNTTEPWLTLLSMDSTWRHLVTLITKLIQTVKDTCGLTMSFFG